MKGGGIGNSRATPLETGFVGCAGPAGWCMGFLTSANIHRDAQILIKFQREPQQSQGALICENPGPVCEAIFCTLK